MSKAIEKVWVGVKPCGCVCAASKDGKLTEAERVSWMRDGLSLLLVERASWERDYLPRFLADCSHKGL